MDDINTLEGSIRREGDLLIGEGQAGMQMMDDTMMLALNKTVKTARIVRTVFGAAATLGVAYLAHKLDNPYLAGSAGVIGTLTFQEGRRALNAAKEYAHVLDEAVSHGWNSREELKKINHRWL